MKKLIMGVAAVAASAAMASGIVSSSVVGYTTESTLADYGFKQVAPMFVNVAKDSVLKLSDISMPNKADGDSIQLFDENGDPKETLTYSRKKIAGVWTYVWENIDGDVVEDYEFPRGSSIWVSTESEIDVTFSGQVAKGVLVVEYGADYAFTQTGNSTPVAVKLSELTFSSLADGDSIQMFDENGDPEETLTYSRKKVAGEWTFVWENIDGDTVDPTTYSFPAGKAFWLSFESAGEMTIPAAVE